MNKNKLVKAHKKEFNCRPDSCIFPFNKTMYVLFFVAGNLNKVRYEKVDGEIRMDKGHPRFFLKNHAKPHCVGLEYWNKRLFDNEKEAIEQMNKLNDSGITCIEWEAWIKEYQNKKYYVDIPTALALCKKL